MLTKVVMFLGITCILEVLGSNPFWNTENPRVFVFFLDPS